MASIEEILAKADIREDGKYYFKSLTEEERKHLHYAGIKDDEIVVDKNYKVGQENDRRFSVVNEGSNDEDKKAGLSADLQKSYDFWNKFNENSARTGIAYNIENVENKCLLVEAKKGEKTVFKGIDHGSRGFDVIKKDNSYEQPLEFFILLVKKAKTSNPKTVIRIKDNVTDPVLRNKILIACAKNNATPVGNLPKGFDFEELKALVRRAQTPEELDELVQALYMQNSNEYAFGTQNSADRSNSNNGEQKKEDGKHPVVAPVILPHGSNNTNNTSGLEARIAEQQAQLAQLQKQLADQHAAQQAAAQKQAEDNKAAINQAAQTAANQATSKREGWFKRNFKKGLLYTTMAAAVLFGFKKCNDKNNDDRINNQTEQLTDNINRLAAENCEGWTNLVSERDSLLQRTQELERDLDDCAKSKIKPAPVKKKIVKKKPAPVVVRDTIKGDPIIMPGDTIKGETVYLPRDTIQGEPVIIPGKVIHQPDTLVQGKKKIVLDGSTHHEIDQDISGDVQEGTVTTAGNGKRQLDSSQQHEIDNETYTGFMETLAKLEQEKADKKQKAQPTDTATVVAQRRILNSNIR